MPERMKEHLVPGYLASLLLEKGARVKLKQPGKEMGIGGTREEIYAVDTQLTLSAEELHPVREHLVGGTRTGQTVTKSGIVLQQRIVFQFYPDWFTEDDSARPAQRGVFVDLSI